MAVEEPNSTQWKGDLHYHQCPHMATQVSFDATLCIPTDWDSYAIMPFENWSRKTYIKSPMLREIVLNSFRRCPKSSGNAVRDGINSTLISLPHSLLIITCDNFPKIVYRNDNIFSSESEPLRLPTVHILLIYCSFKSHLSARKQTKWDAYMLC